MLHPEKKVTTVMFVEVLFFPSPRGHSVYIFLHDEPLKMPIDDLHRLLTTQPAVPCGVLESTVQCYASSFTEHRKDSFMCPEQSSYYVVSVSRVSVHVHVHERCCWLLSGSRFWSKKAERIAAPQNNSLRGAYVYVFVLTLPCIVLSRWGYFKYNIHLQTGTLGQWAHQ